MILKGKKSKNQGYEFAPYIKNTELIIPVKFIGFNNGKLVFKKKDCKHNKVKTIYEINKYQCKECGLKFN